MNISYAATFTQHLDSPPSNSIKFAFLYLSRCCAVITVILLLLLLLVSKKSRGELMARRMNFPKLRLGEYTASSSLCLCQYPLEVSHCSRNRISVSSIMISKGFLTLLQMMYFSYSITMETTIGRISIR